MVSAKIFIVIMLLVWFLLPSHCDAWRRRRRRRCPVRNCDITSWSYWSYCTADRCGEQGYQSRSRMIVSKPSCGGTACPDNRFESRRCYGSRSVDCELSYWSEWSACTTPCGVSGKQTSFRHRLTTEQCGGSCSSYLIRTRSCPRAGCFNGGSIKNGACFCRAGFSGDCCQMQEKMMRCRGLTSVVDCQLSSWSEWGPCTTKCGAAGKQTSTRHRIVTEKCGGTCPGGSNLAKTRTCPQINCLNGGSLMNGACVCEKGYSGDCCEKEKSSDSKKLVIGLTVPASFIFMIMVCICIYKLKDS